MARWSARILFNVKEIAWALTAVVIRRPNLGYFQMNQTENGLEVVTECGSISIFLLNYVIFHMWYVCGMLSFIYGHLLSPRMKITCLREGVWFYDAYNYYGPMQLVSRFVVDSVSA